ncbi:hypothetical protein PQR63_16185 [Herbaspirillum rhizosphaerae]|uniref:Uncharacterized protein n=1 Tax=Herbaspirillum rhizosphaerae TaxID=346179 RepID=A0ABW8ZAW9_9BURK
MAKSTSNHTTIGGTQPQQASQANAAEAEVQQARHRTTIRIAGIEGVDGFADVLDTDDNKPLTEKH